MDVKEGGGGGGGVLPKRPVDVKRGKSEYVDGPLCGAFFKVHLQHKGLER